MKMEQRYRKLLPFCLIQGAEGSCLSMHASQLHTAVGAECLAVRFVKLALLWTVPTFFTSRETTGTGRLPDLIKLKDIQMDRLGEASDPLRFNLFGSIMAAWSLVDIGWNTRENASFTRVDRNTFLTPTIWVRVYTPLWSNECDNSSQ